MRNTATYCDGKSREFTAALFTCTGTIYAAIAGQTCRDPLDCVALTADEAETFGRAWAARRTTMLATDLATMFEVIPLPDGWSND